MSLRLIADGNLSDASDVNQVIDVLQREVGQQEKGWYHITANCYQANAHVGNYINSLSRNSAPSGVTVDTTGGLTNIGGVATSDLSANGFSVGGTGVQNLNVQASGNYTIQY